MLTDSCFQCIRGGWSWCSAKWNYESAAAITTSELSTEKGYCCYRASTATTDEAASRCAANVAVCPARWTNAPDDGGAAAPAAVALTTNVESAWWCSPQMASEELALITCRQRIDVCQAGIIPAFTAVTAASTTTTRTVTIASMNTFEKCSWVTKATIGAPTF